MRQSKRSVKSSVQLTLSNQFQRFDTADGIELVIDTQTGESFATINGYARMASLAKSTVSERLTTVRKEDIKTAEIQTTTGFKTVRLIPENIISKWIIRDNPDLAERMLNAGVRVYIHTLAGFKVTSTATKPQQPELTKLELAELYVEAEKERQRLQSALEAVQEDLKAIEAHRTELPGLVEMFDGLKVSKVLEDVPYGFYTINNILTLGKYPLTHIGERIAIGSILAKFYRVFTKQETLKCRVQITDKNGNERNVYQACYPISFLKIAKFCLDHYFYNRDGNSFINH